MKLFQNAYLNCFCTLIVALGAYSLFDKQLIIHLTCHMKLCVYNHLSVNKEGIAVVTAPIGHNGL